MALPRQNVSVFRARPESVNFLSSSNLVAFFDLNSVSLSPAIFLRDYDKIWSILTHVISVTSMDLASQRVHMAISEKIRLLSHFMPAGFHTFERNGRTYIALDKLPYEWSEIIPRWLMVQPARVEHDSPDCDLIEIEPGNDASGMAMTASAWEDFVCWISHAAKDRLNELEERAERGEQIGLL